MGDFIRALADHPLAGIGLFAFLFGTITLVNTCIKEAITHWHVSRFTAHQVWKKHEAKDE